MVNTSIAVSGTTGNQLPLTIISQEKVVKLCTLWMTEPVYIEVAHKYVKLSW